MVRDVSIPPEISQNVSPLFFPFFLFGVTTMVIVGFGSIIVNILFLPAKLTLFHSNSVVIYSFILGLGALAAVIGNPLTGAFLDRHRQKRRLCLASGTLLLIGALLLIVQSSSIIVLAISVILAQLASAGMLYSVLATMILQTPSSQRAMASAVMGVAPLIGGVVGQLLYTQALHMDMQKTTFVFIGLIVISVSLLLVWGTSLLPEEELTIHTAPSPMSLLHSLHAFRSPHFSWTWASRFLICLGYTTTLNYSPLFLGAQQQLFFAASVAALVVMAFITGRLSDYFQCRKIFVISASLLLGVGLALLGFGWNLMGLIVASALFGLGYGAYQSSDLALATEVLPSEEDGGRDLGLMNAAVFLPMIVAPILTTGILALFHSYTALLLVLAAGAWIAALCIVNVKRIQQFRIEKEREHDTSRPKARESSRLSQKREWVADHCQP